MNARGWLMLTGVQVARESVPTIDVYGNRATASTTLTTLDRAAIWQAGSSTALISQKLAAASTHVLVAETSDYDWNQYDRFVVWDGDTYRVLGRPDDVMAQGKITVVALELIE